MSNEVVKSSDIRLIQLNNYVRPKVSENKSKGYVMNGPKNEFYQYIIDRYNGSPTNAAIINSYVDLIYGKGLSATNASTKTEDWVKLKTALKSKELKKIISDFELFGEASMQVIETKGKGLSEILHIPKQKLIPSIEDEDGNITSYWFSRDWTKLYQNPAEEIQLFDGKHQKISAYVIRPYKAGKDYFSDPDYLAGLPYAEMEEEISNYYVNHIKNGLSFGYIINIPDGNNLSNEEKDELERKIKEKLTGSSNAGKFVLSFNGRDAEITVTPIEVNSAHKQWEYLTSESRQQILTAHRVTSPMLFGIKDNTGLGNNADELDTAEAQLMKRVIAPKQRYILEALEEILTLYNINLDLTFRPITEQTTQIGLSNEKKKTDLDLFIESGEVIGDEWELIDEIEVDYEEEEKLSIQLTSTGTARPNSKSSQDGENFIVRYKYVGNKSPQREFCQKMMAADKVYRKEDIMQMGGKAVNPGWGPNGADTYSIWLYKGGGSCHHKWNRVIYLKRGSNIDVNSPLAQIISTSEARRRGMKLETNNSLVSVAPANMPNEGFLNPR